MEDAEAEAEAVSREIGALVRDMQFEELDRLSRIAASYAHSIGEASFRGDQLTAGVHVRQIRLVVIAMIKVFNGLDAPPAPCAQLEAAPESVWEREAEPSSAESYVED